MSDIFTSIFTNRLKQSDMCVEEVNRKVRLSAALCAG